MGPNDDVQFLSPDGTPLPDALGPQGAVAAPKIISRRSVLGVLALVAVLVAAGFVLNGRHPTSRPPAPHSADQAAPTVATPSSDVGAAEPLGPGPVDQAAAAAGRVFAVQAGRLVSIDPDDRHLFESAALTGFPDPQSVIVVADPGGSTVFVISRYRVPTRVTAFDAVTLVPTASEQWTGSVSSGAVLGGKLFLAGSALATWDPHAPGSLPVIAVDSVSGPFESIAADPVRHRVLLVRSAPRQVVAYNPGGGALTSGPVLVMPSAQLAVVDGRIWIVGPGPTPVGVVAFVDPVGLAVGISASVVVDLGLGAGLSGTGDHVLWLRNAEGQGALWCVDAQDGRVRQTWTNAPGTVASTNGMAYAATGQVLEPLALRGCPG